MSEQTEKPRKSSRGWALILVAAFVGMLAVQPIGAAVKEITTKAMAPENPYQKIQADMVRKLPIAVDEITTLIDFTIEPAAATYVYQLADNTRGFDVARIREKNSLGICKTWETSFRNRAINAAVYRYLLRGTSYSFTVVPSDCGFH